MNDVLPITDDNRDAEADETIFQCLNPNSFCSFFLFAGAGSGKTKSLVSSLNYINTSFGKTLKLSGRKVAVITYTNAARDEIKRRIVYNSLFDVSTIHSFAWNMISSHTSDIRKQLKEELQLKIDELTNKQAASRNKTTKTYIEREKKLVALKERIEYLDSVKKFTYNPDGINIDKNSLDHSEVIKLSSSLLSTSHTMQNILIDKYPILLIDESQDTKRELMEVFLQIQSTYPDRFMLGLFGDMMQRIYLDGKTDLQSAIPSSWQKPQKIMNHRSQARIVALCNSIRKDVDGVQQQARAEKQGGFVHLFVANSSSDPQIVEKTVAQRMSQITLDEKWLVEDEVKHLTIEHKMAAQRLGFGPFFESLRSIPSYQQGLINGNLSAIGLFTHILIPLYMADINNNPFEKMSIIKKYSNLFKEKRKNLSFDDLNALNASVEDLCSRWKNQEPTCMELLQLVYEKNIFPVTGDLRRLVEDPPSPQDEDYAKYTNLFSALNATLQQVQLYCDYIERRASFDTHQGVKGLEFDRVMVIADDQSSRMSTFSYNKLFGMEEKSATDIENERTGKETTVDRTKRLLYVTCSRARNSLAIVYYSSNITSAMDAILKTGWFFPEEVEQI